LVRHITEARWREVFLLAVEMTKNGDELLRAMKPQVDLLVALDKKLQVFMEWVNLKSFSIEAPYKLATVRAFYFNLISDLSYALDFTVDFAIDPVLNFAIDPALSLATDLHLDLNLARALDRALVVPWLAIRTRDFLRDRALRMALELNSNLNLSLRRAVVIDLAIALNLELEYEVQSKLQYLKDQLPKIESDEESHKHWWATQGQSWAERLRAVMREYRNIGHDWQFSDDQKELLKQYYEASKLLVDC
jgi:predicted NACHT family NTPase